MRYVLDALPRSHSLFPGIAMALIRGSLARSLADRLDYRLLLMGSIGYGTLNYAVLVNNEDPGRHVSCISPMTPPRSLCPDGAS